MAVQAKKTDKGGFAKAKTLGNEEDEKANREQNRNADLRALNHQRETTNALKEQLYQVEISSERRKNAILRWLPVGVCVTTLVILGAYFYILMLSGAEDNNFSLDPMVLSSVGATSVAGSFALIGYMLKGIFKVSSKPQKKKSR